MVDDEAILQNSSSSDNNTLDLTWPCIVQCNAALQVTSPTNEEDGNLMLERKSDEVSLSPRTTTLPSSSSSSSSSSTPLCEETSTTVVENDASLEANNALPVVPVLPAPEYVPPEKALCAAELECCAAIDKKKVKTVLCVNYMRYGSCKFGSHCAFAHGFDELRPPVDVNLNDKCSTAHMSPEAVNESVSNNDKSPDNVNDFHAYCKEISDKSVTLKTDAALQVAPPSYHELYNYRHSQLFQRSDDNIKETRNSKSEHMTRTVTRAPSHSASSVVNTCKNRNSASANTVEKMISFSSSPLSSSYISTFTSLVPTDSSLTASPRPLFCMEQDNKHDTCPLDTTFLTPSIDIFTADVDGSNACKCCSTPFNNCFSSKHLHRNNNGNQWYKAKLRSNAIGKEGNHQTKENVVKSTLVNNCATNTAHNNFSCDCHWQEVNGIESEKLMNPNERNMHNRQRVKRNVSRINKETRNTLDFECKCDGKYWIVNNNNNNSTNYCYHNTGNKYGGPITESQMCKCSEWCTNNKNNNIDNGSLTYDALRVQDYINDISNQPSENKPVTKYTVSNLCHNQFMISNEANRNSVHYDHCMCNQTNVAELMHECKTKESRKILCLQSDTPEECVNTDRETQKWQPIQNKQAAPDQTSSARRECYCKTVSLDENRNVIVYYGRP